MNDYDPRRYAGYLTHVPSRYGFTELGDVLWKVEGWSEEGRF